jgi:hypothetical protein
VLKPSSRRVAVTTISSNGPLFAPAGAAGAAVSARAKPGVTMTASAPQIASRGLSHV